MVSRVGGNHVFPKQDLWTRTYLQVVENCQEADVPGNESSPLGRLDELQQSGQLAMADGRLKFVTALAETDVAEGWRPTKATSGCRIDLDSEETVIRGLAMPHSPRIHEGRVWLLDSGRGRLVVADLARGAVETVAELPGYTRGLALIGSLAFVGMSKLRQTNRDTGGVPIAGRNEPLKCGVAVVDLASGRQVALLEFQSGIEEVFDVQVLAGIRCPLISGPNPHVDGRAVWFVP